VETALHFIMCSLTLNSTVENACILYSALLPLVTKKEHTKSVLLFFLLNRFGK